MKLKRKYERVCIAKYTWHMALFDTSLEIYEWDKMRTRCGLFKDTNILSILHTSYWISPVFEEGAAIMQYDQ